MRGYACSPPLLALAVLVFVVVVFFVISSLVRSKPWQSLSRAVIINFHSGYLARFDSLDADLGRNEGKGNRQTYSATGHRIFSSLLSFFFHFCACFLKRRNKFKENTLPLSARCVPISFPCPSSEPSFSGEPGTFRRAARRQLELERRKREEEREKNNQKNLVTDTLKRYDVAMPPNYTTPFGGL